MQRKRKIQVVSNLFTYHPTVLILSKKNFSPKRERLTINVRLIMSNKSSQNPRKIYSNSSTEKKKYFVQFLNTRKV